MPHSRISLTSHIGSYRSASRKAIAFKKRMLAPVGWMCSFVPR
jgi:hypothetical protein